MAQHRPHKRKPHKGTPVEPLKGPCEVLALFEKSTAIFRVQGLGFRVNVSTLCYENLRIPVKASLRFGGFRVLQGLPEGAGVQRSSTRDP